MPIEIKAGYLDQLQIATPCRANWQRMEKVDGNDSVRFCQSCQKNVYKLSLMSREEAMTLLREKDGQICARLSRRTDGTLIFGDCPVGQSAQRQRRRLGAALMALLIAFIPSPVSHALKSGTARVVRAVPFVADTHSAKGVLAWLDNAPDDVTMGELLPIRPPASSTNPPTPNQ